MKPWVREAVLWVGIAFMSSIINFLFLRWVASLPRIGFVPFPAACERMNTFLTGFWVFVIVLAFGAMRVVLRELKRRVFAPYRSPKLSLSTPCPLSENEGPKPENRPKSDGNSDENRAPEEAKRQ